MILGWEPHGEGGFCFRSQGGFAKNMARDAMFRTVGHALFILAYFVIPR